MLRKLPDPEINKTAIRAIRCTIRQSIRRGWFRQEEFEDLVHDAVVQLLQKLDCYDPYRSSWQTFCSLVTRHYLLSELKRRKRRNLRPDSIFDEVESAGEKVRLGDLIEERHLPGQRFSECRSETEQVELRDDLRCVLDSLPEDLQQLCDCCCKQQTLNDVADNLGLSRNTIYRKRKVVREYVAEHHLSEYQY